MKHEIPKICCTCIEWEIIQPAKIKGVCNLHNSITNYNKTCEAWGKYKNENDQCVATLGYD